MVTQKSRPSHSHTPLVTAVKYSIRFVLDPAQRCFYLYFVYLPLFTFFCIYSCVFLFLWPSVFDSSELGQELVLNFPTRTGFVNSGLTDSCRLMGSD